MRGGIKSGEDVIYNLNFSKATWHSSIQVKEVLKALKKGKHFFTILETNLLSAATLPIRR